MNSPASEHVTQRYVAIGASGGNGLEDIQELLGALPHPVAAVVMVVLHRPTDRISRLREILAAATPTAVVVAQTGETFEPGRIYIGEPAQHLTLLTGNEAGLIPGDLNEHRNRTIDLLFHSLAVHGVVGHWRRALGILGRWLARAGRHSSRGGRDNGADATTWRCRHA